MTDIAMLPESWRGVLGDELEQPYFKELTEFVEEERAKGPVYPPREEVFAALEATPYDKVKVLVLGQTRITARAVATGCASRSVRV